MKKKIEQLIYDFRYDKKFWTKDGLTGDEHTFERSKPLPYINLALELLKLLDGKVIVEIGRLRHAVSYKCLDYAENIDATVSPPCCNDGHSTFFLAKSGMNLFSCDIDPHTNVAVEYSYQNIKEEVPSNIKLFLQDGVEFLRDTDFEYPIDLLFLDGWDKGTHQYAESHLEAYRVVKSKLNANNIIVVDDTDFNTESGGKDKLLTPVLIDDGYRCVVNGRQTIWLKNES